tara:strand:+ start:10 stop:543 length:534 start_codon:yes stop_codon:yes gene_type:complete
MNKRGQVFLMAAVLIAGVILGVSNIELSITVGDPNEAFYDLSEEVGFEIKKVLDYGTFNDEDVRGLLADDKEFILEYEEYIEKEQLALIVGNESNMVIYWFEKDSSGTVGLSSGGDSANFVIAITDVMARNATVSKSGDKVIVEINDIEYEFELRDGQNFFFVMIKHKDGEKFVAKG